MSDVNILEDLSKALNNLQDSYYMLNDVVDILSKSYNDVKKVNENVDLSKAIAKAIEVRASIKSIGDLIVVEGNKLS